MGIAVGVIAAAIPSFFYPDELMYLKLVGPDSGQTAGQRDAQQSVLEKVWTCGGRNFSAALPTHAVDVNIPITSENKKIADCVIKAAAGTDISITIANGKR
ncbi:hypothetical protein [Sphingopyxis sp.]|uniref:hypothetical protein n=1 Tax=Sphingopyxis sp. TaxID=1908224 RepID=UPI003F710F33